MAKKSDRKNLWKYREARDVKPIDRFIYYVLLFVGLVSIFRFADWWFKKEHIQSLPLFILLSLIIWYGIFRIVLIWINYSRIKNLNLLRPRKD